MSDLDEKKIRRLDLTVLLVFLGLMRHRKATRVAQDLSLTGPAVSHALRRLRDLFDDPLFLRRPHGFDPTARALAIEPNIRRALEAIQDALAGSPAFDPRTATSEVRLSARDRELVSIVPEVLSRAAVEAPGLAFSIRSIPATESVTQLRDGALDLAIGFFGSPPADTIATVLRRESYLVAARVDHPIFDTPLTPESYAAQRHVLVATDGSRRGIVDRALREIGLSRRVAVSLPQFLPALATLRGSDFVGTLPATLVRRHAAHFGLDSCDVPFPLRAFDVSILRHQRDRKNGLLDWVVERFVEQAGRAPTREAAPEGERTDSERDSSAVMIE